MKYDTVRVYEFRFHELIESEKRCEKFEQAFEKIRADIEHTKDNPLFGTVSNDTMVEVIIEIIDKYRDEVMSNV